MILVFHDDGSMRVIDSADQANYYYESIDVENHEYTFIDSFGYVLMPVFRSPKKKRFLFLFPIVVHGPFLLESTDRRNDDLLRKLESGEIKIVQGSTGIRTLDQLRVACPDLLRK